MVIGFMSHNISQSRFDKVFSSLADKYGLKNEADKKKVVILAKTISGSNFFKERRKKLQSGIEL